MIHPAVATVLDGSLWPPLLGLLISLAVLYALGLLLLWRYARAHPDTLELRDALRLLPDVLRLVRRLAADRGLPRGLRLRLGLLLVYLLIPVDLVPDVIPILGYADDLILIALVLRSVARRAGPAALETHWPGSPEGLRLVRRLAGLE